MKKPLSIFLLTLAITGTCWGMNQKRAAEEQEKLDRNLYLALEAKINDARHIKLLLSEGARIEKNILKDIEGFAQTEDKKTILHCNSIPRQRELAFYHLWKTARINDTIKTLLIKLETPIIKEALKLNSNFLTYLKAKFQDCKTKIKEELEEHKNDKYQEKYTALLQKELKEYKKILKIITKEEKERPNYAIQETNQEQVQKIKIIVNGQNLTIFKTLLC